MQANNAYDDHNFLNDINAIIDEVESYVRKYDNQALVKEMKNYPVKIQLNMLGCALVCSIRKDNGEEKLLLDKVSDAILKYDSYESRNDVITKNGCYKKIIRK